MVRKWMALIAFNLCIGVMAQEEFSLEIQADLLIAKAKQHIGAEEWSSAARAFEKIQALKVTLPDKFNYYYGMSLCRSGELEAGMQQLMHYLMNTNGQGIYHEDAMRLLVVAKNVQVEQKPYPFPEQMDTALRAEILVSSIKYNEQNDFLENCDADYQQLMTMNETISPETRFVLGRVQYKRKQYGPAYKLMADYVKRSGREAPYYEDALEIILDCKKHM